MPIHQVLRLGRGAIIELDSSEEDEVRILANNMPVAKGTVIVSGNRIAVEVKELLPRMPDAARRLGGRSRVIGRRAGCGSRACPRKILLLHRRHASFNVAFTPHAAVAELVDALA